MQVFSHQQTLVYKEPRAAAPAAAPASPAPGSERSRRSSEARQPVAHGAVLSLTWHQRSPEPRGPTSSGRRWLTCIQSHAHRNDDLHCWMLPEEPPLRQLSAVTSDHSCLPALDGSSKAPGPGQIAVRHTSP